MVVKVKEPLEAEYGLLRKDQILFTYLHLAASKSLTDALLKSGVTGVAYETILVNNRLPLLEPMSEIAGRMSVTMGAYYLAKYNGGNGVLLGGVPGVLPGKVVVIGGGTSGVHAARMAVGLGADVTILEVDLDKMRFLDMTMPQANTLYSSEANLLELMPADRRGARARCEGAEAHHARDAAQDEARQCARGHCHRSRRLRGDFPRHHPHRSDLCRGGRDPLLRGKHARRVRPHRHPGADECHLPVCGAAGESRPRSRVPEAAGADRRHQHTRRAQ
jgi:hypothetical protein